MGVRVCWRRITIEIIENISLLQQTKAEQNATVSALKELLDGCIRMCLTKKFYAKKVESTRNQRATPEWKKKRPGGVGWFATAKMSSLIVATSERYSGCQHKVTY